MRSLHLEIVNGLADEMVNELNNDRRVMGRLGAVFSRLGAMFGRLFHMLSRRLSMLQEPEH
jgi:hypothetical protein